MNAKYDHEAAIEPVLSDLGELLNATLTAADVGLNLDYQDAANSVTLSSEQGLGRIAGEDVGALRQVRLSFKQGGRLEDR